MSCKAKKWTCLKRRRKQMRSWGCVVIQRLATRRSKQTGQHKQHVTNRHTETNSHWRHPANRVSQRVQNTELPAHFMVTITATDRRGWIDGGIYAFKLLYCSSCHLAIYFLFFPCAVSWCSFGTCPAAYLWTSALHSAERGGESGGMISFFNFLYFVGKVETLFNILLTVNWEKIHSLVALKCRWL